MTKEEKKSKKEKKKKNKKKSKEKQKQKQKQKVDDDLFGSQIIDEDEDTPLNKGLSLIHISEPTRPY